MNKVSWRLLFHFHSAIFWPLWYQTLVGYTFHCGMGVNRRINNSVHTSEIVIANPISIPYLPLPTWDLGAYHHIKSCMHGQGNLSTSWKTFAFIQTWILNYCYRLLFIFPASTSLPSTSYRPFSIIMMKNVSLILLPSIHPHTKPICQCQIHSLYRTHLLTYPRETRKTAQLRVLTCDGFV